jgi:hypothetical protein
MAMVPTNGKRQRAVVMEDGHFMLGLEHKDTPPISKFCVGIVTVLRVIMVFALINKSFLNILAHPRWNWAGKSCLL